jgi:exonuclease VII small subunit
MGPTSVEAALERLEAAVSKMEDVVERRIEADRVHAGRDIEVQALSDDRSRLADELDASYARFARLETANREASQRLDQAIDTIRLVLSPQAKA